MLTRQLQLALCNDQQDVTINDVVFKTWLSALEELQPMPHGRCCFLALACYERLKKKSWLSLPQNQSLEVNSTLLNIVA